MRKTLIAGLTGLAVASGIALASPANAAQGGNDTSGPTDKHHAWMKVASSELQRKTVDQACEEAVRTDPPSCNRLVMAIVNEKSKNPKANGYWAEWYYNTYKNYTGPGWPAIRSGTW